MKPTLLFLLPPILGAAIVVFSQSMSPPSAVSKDRVLQMASKLTNGMPEQVANTLLTNQGLRCSYATSAMNARTCRYNFTDGWFGFEVRPKEPLSRDQWRRHRRGFVTAA